MWESTEASENEEAHVVVKAIEKFDALLESESSQRLNFSTNFKMTKICITGSLMVLYFALSACFSRTCCATFQARLLLLLQDRTIRHSTYHQKATRTTRKTLSQTSSSSYFYMAKDDNNNNIDTLVPETSFGSESVPEAQRPINEYLDMKTQPLFGWASLDSGNIGLLRRLALVYIVAFVAVCYPIPGATYTQDGYLWQKVLASNVGGLSLVGFLLLRIYTGWSYVGQRLASKTVEFEETGWYDGNVEKKTPAEQKRDKFLYLENVQPIVQRLQTISLGLFGLWIASIVAFQVSASQKPIFEQYDPKVLERLGSDDKLADVAAQNSGGKPIYCDNRYYRAIANGGQGCD
jgi:Conserved in the green lineage and diatoms 27